MSRNSRAAKHQPTWLTGQSLETARANGPILDYKKACDSVPHTWTLECLELYKIHRTLRAFSYGRATRRPHSGPLHKSWIKNGIYQSDATSQLLMDLNHLSQTTGKKMNPGNH